MNAPAAPARPPTALTRAPTPTGLPMFEPTPDDTRRMARIAKAWAAYRGEFKDSLKVPQGQPNDNVNVNRCVGIVDTGVDWMTSKPFTYDVLPKGGKPLKPGQKPPPQYQAYQAYLDELFEDSDDMMTLFSMNCQNGAIAGHTFMQIVWDSQRMEVPRLTLVNPQDVYVTSDPDDVNNAICYTIETLSASPVVTSGGSPVTTKKRRVILRQDPDGNARYTGGQDADDTWTVADYESSGTATGGRWRPVPQPDGSPVLHWPYPFPPIVDAMNLTNPNEYWGLSDLSENLIHLNERLNFVRSNTNRIIKFHAMPWGLIAGAGGEQGRLDIAPGSLLKVPMGATLLMPAVYGDIAGSRDHAKDLLGDMDEQSRVPAIAFGRQENLPRGNIPGVTAELFYNPLLAKTLMKRRLYGRMWRNVCLWCLALKFGVGVLKTVRIELHWPSMLPADDLAAAQSLQLIDAIGIASKHTLAGRQDLDYDREAELMAEEAVEEAKRHPVPPQLAGVQPPGQSGAPVPPGPPGQRPAPAPPATNPGTGGNDGGAP